MFYKAGLELRGQACPVGLDGCGIGTVRAVSFDAARKTQGQALIHFEPLASPALIESAGHLRSHLATGDGRLRSPASVACPACVCLEVLNASLAWSLVPRTSISVEDDDDAVEAAIKKFEIPSSSAGLIPPASPRPCSPLSCALTRPTRLTGCGSYPFTPSKTDVARYHGSAQQCDADECERKSGHLISFSLGFAADHK